MFYKLNGSKVTLKEFWWETKLFVWVGALVKLLKIRLRGSTDDLACDSLTPFVVDESKLPNDVLDRFKPTIAQLNALGFTQPIWHDQENIYQATHNTIATLGHESGRAWVRVQCRTNFVRFPAKIKFFSTFISKIPGGFIVTGNGKYDMAWPATHHVVRYRSMGVEQVWSVHQQRMTAAVQRITLDQLARVAEEYHKTLVDFHLARGVFEPLGEEEYAMLPAPPAPLTTPPMPPAIVSTEDDVPTLPPALPPAPLDLLEVATLDELRRLQNKRGNWRFSVGLLAISAIFFVVNSRTSDREQDWQYLGMLVGILLVHELGHYLAMKIFGYRNLKMFFIPGFGAAVSGRHYNAPAWKKIIVSLMGPLPGILAGTILLILYGIFHIELLYKISLFAIIINAFNLIPILPFDGGWVAHAALFSRNPKLDVGFRLIAALLLIGIGIKVPGAGALTYVAIATLVALPIANRLAVIVGELRQIPGLGLSPDSQTIPPETARIILSKIRQRFKRNLTARLAAQHVASVFESLNARPPSIGATFGLISLHAGGFALALIVAVAALATHGHNLFHPRGLEAKRYDVTAAEIESVPFAISGARNIVIARFKSAAGARDLFNQLPLTRAHTQFGQNLMVSFTPDEMLEQKGFFNRCLKLADDVFVESSKMQSNVELTFTIPETNAVVRRTMIWKFTCRKAAGD